MGSHTNGYSFPEGKQVRWNSLNLYESTVEHQLPFSYSIPYICALFLSIVEMCLIIFNKLLLDSLNDRTGKPLNAQWILNY